MKPEVKGSWISKFAWLAAVAWLLAIAGCGNATDADGPDAVQLTQADWEVQNSKGFTPAPFILNKDALPTHWQPIALPHALPVSLLKQAGTKRANGVAADTRTTWYRLALPSLPESKQPLGLYIARIRTDGTVAMYADGYLIHTAQQRGPLWNSSRTPLLVKLDNSLSGKMPREITIRIEHSAATQIALSSVWLGSIDAISWRFHGREWFQQELPRLFSAAFLAVGLFALVVWLRRLHEPGYLLFFVLSATAFTRGMHFYVDFPIASDWFAWLTVNSLFWLVTLVHFSIVLLHRRRQRWLTGALAGACSVMAVLTLPMWAAIPNTPKVTPLLYALAALMGLVVGAVGLFSARTRSHEATVIAGGALLCTLLGTSDWLLQNNFISPENWYLGAYTSAICFCVFSYVIYRRYVGAISDVEQANAHLSHRLAARETELAVSYERMSKIEHSQTLSDERQRLMQDMHDGLGSTLISAIRSVEAGGMSDTKVTQILKDCMDDLKLAIDSMEPVEADLLLLLATLRFRLEPRLEGTGVELVWRVQELPELDWLEPSSALHILRIVQESVSNVLRHTNATQICVGTSIAGDGVLVSITDNGQGFDVAKALEAATGKGLINQQRRAQTIGAKILWKAAPDGGTCFSLWLPLVRSVG